MPFTYTTAAGETLNNFAAAFAELAQGLRERIILFDGDDTNAPSYTINTGSTTKNPTAADFATMYIRDDTHKDNITAYRAKFAYPGGVAGSAGKVWIDPDTDILFETLGEIRDKGGFGEDWVPLDDVWNPDVITQLQGIALKLYKIAYLPSDSINNAGTIAGHSMSTNITLIYATETDMWDAGIVRADWGAESGDRYLSALGVEFFVVHGYTTLFGDDWGLNTISYGGGTMADLNCVENTLSSSAWDSVFGSGIPGTIYSSANALIAWSTYDTIIFGPSMPYLIGIDDIHVFNTNGQIDETFDLAPNSEIRITNDLGTTAPARSPIEIEIPTSTTFATSGGVALADGESIVFNGRFHFSHLTFDRDTITDWATSNLTEYVHCFTDISADLSYI